MKPALMSIDVPPILAQTDRFTLHFNFDGIYFTFAARCLSILIGPVDVSLYIRLVAARFFFPSLLSKVLFRLHRIQLESCQMHWQCRIV